MRLDLEREREALKLEEERLKERRRKLEERELTELVKLFSKSPLAALSHARARALFKLIADLGVDEVERRLQREHSRAST